MSEAKPEKIETGQMVEICVARCDGRLPRVVKNVNGRDVRLAELDGCRARVLTQGHTGRWVDVKPDYEVAGRGGRVMVPEEVLKPVGQVK